MYKSPLYIPALSKEELLAIRLQLQAGKKLFSGKGRDSAGGQQDDHKPAVSWQQKRLPISWVVLTGTKPGVKDSLQCMASVQEKKNMNWNNTGWD